MIEKCSRTKPPITDPNVIPILKAEIFKLEAKLTVEVFPFSEQYNNKLQTWHIHECEKSMSKIEIKPSIW